MPRGRTELAWTQHAPHSYVTLDSAPAPALARPATFTLVGPGTPCVVTVTDTVYVRSNNLGTHRAFVVPAATCPGEYVMAVAGVDRAPRAHRRLGRQTTSAATTAWAERALGARISTDDVTSDPEPGARAAYLERVPGTNVDAIFAFVDHPNARSTIELLLRRHGRLIARLGDMDLVGHLTWDGRDYLVVRDERHDWLRYTRETIHVKAL
jgi:hypothetical protein